MDTANLTECGYCGVSAESVNDGGFDFDLNSAFVKSSSRRKVSIVQSALFGAFYILFTIHTHAHWQSISFNIKDKENGQGSAGTTIRLRACTRCRCVAYCR